MPKKNTPKSKRSIRPEFREAVWSQLRGLYGSGLFESLESLHLHAKTMFIKCPSLSAILTRCTKEKWTKTLHRDRLDAAQERSFQKLFEDEGFGDVEMVKTVVAGAKHADQIFSKIMDRLSEDKTITVDTVESLKAFVSDLKVSRLFIAERNKLTGAYAANKVRGSGGLAGSLTDGADDEDTEELLLEHDRISKSLSL